MRNWLLAIAIVLLGASAAMANDARQNSLRITINEEFRTIGNPKTNFHDMRRALEGVVADPAFPSLTDVDHVAAYFVLGFAEYQTGDYPASLNALRMATALPASEIVWTYRFYAAMGAHEYDDAALSAVKVIKTWPSNVSKFTDESLIDLDGNLNSSPAEEKRHGEFLEALAAISWRPQDPFTSADPMWLALARIRLAAGDVPGATAVAQRITDPSLLIEMRSDKRFDALVAADPAHYDIAAAYDRELADAKAQSAAMPDKLIGVNAVANFLITLNRGQEALAILDDAIARGRRSNSAFSDYDDEIIWTQNERSSALLLLNRYDEGIAALKAGANASEHGGTNISQAINLADTYNVFDRPNDALAAVAKLDETPMSSYGLTALAEARAQAYFLLKDQANLDKQLDYLRAHSDEGWSTYLDALIFIDDQDNAAKAIIADLEDPAKRPDMLFDLQDYSAGGGETPREAKEHETFMAIRARPDVQAEIMKVGRIAQYPRIRPFH